MDFKFNFNLDDTVYNQAEKEAVEQEPHLVSSPRTYTLQQLTMEGDNDVTIEEIVLQDREKLYHVIERSEEGDNKLMGESDLIRGVYEGGLKVWECALDLTHYVSELEMKGAVVMEIGCGAGLPGIMAARKGAKCVIFQDFNDFVLRRCTAPSLRHNMKMHKSADLKGIYSRERFRFMSGNWLSIKHVIQSEADVVLSSETIYEQRDYAALHGLIDAALTVEGVAYIASKRFYFGVGGGICEWMDFVKKRGRFKIEPVLAVDATVRREILKMKRIHG